MLVDHLQENKERIQEFKETGDSWYIYWNVLGKSCFQHNMTYADFKDLTRETASDKILLDKAFDIAKNQKYDGYQKGVASFVCRFIDKKTSASRARSETLSKQATRNKFAGSGVQNKNISNKELAEELHKPNIRKCQKQEVHLYFIDNIWGADLADMQLVSKFKKTNTVFYVLLIFSVNTQGLFL